MASKKKANAKAKAKTAKAPPAREKVKPSEAIGVCPEGKLKSLLTSARSTTKDVASLTGSLREKIAYAVENNHLHTKAFGVVRTLDRMEPEKLADFLDHFEHYMEVSGLNERAKSAQRLQFGPGGEEASDDDGEDGEAGESEAEANPGNVRMLRAAE